MDCNELVLKFISILPQILLRFFGRGEEDPYIHLQRYEQTIFGFLVNVRRLIDYIPITSSYSLYDDAHVWFSALPPASLSCWSSFQECFIQTYTRREPTIADMIQQMQLQMKQIEENFELQRVQSQALEDSGFSKEPCYEDDHILPPLENEKNDEIVMSEDEDENIHFQWKEEIFEQEEDEHSIEVVYESLGMLGHRALFGDYVVGEVFDQGEQSGHLQPLEEELQQPIQIPHTRPLDTSFEEGKPCDSSVLLFDEVPSPSTGDMDEHCLLPNSPPRPRLVLERDVCWSDDEEDMCEGEALHDLHDIVVEPETDPPIALCQMMEHESVGSIEEDVHFEQEDMCVDKSLLVDNMEPMPCPLAVSPLQMFPLLRLCIHPSLASYVREVSHLIHPFLNLKFMLSLISDPVSICLLGQESSLCGPINELGIQLPPPTNFIAMDFIPSLEFPFLESKDPLSNEVEEGFIDATTSDFDRDSSQDLYILEFSKEHDINVLLEIPTCNCPSPSFPLLLEYEDPFLPIVPKVFETSFQGDMSLATLRKIQAHILLRSTMRKWLGSDAWIARHGDPTLAEERKEQLEQLTTSNEDHRSALCDQGGFYLVGVVINNILCFLVLF